MHHRATALVKSISLNTSVNEKYSTGATNGLQSPSSTSPANCNANNRNSNNSNTSVVTIPLPLTSNTVVVTTSGSYSPQGHNNGSSNNSSNNNNPVKLHPVSPNALQTSSSSPIVVKRVIMLRILFVVILVVIGSVIFASNYEYRYHLARSGTDDRSGDDKNNKHNLVFVNSPSPAIADDNRRNVGKNVKADERGADDDFFKAFNKKSPSSVIGRQHDGDDNSLDDMILHHQKNVQANRVILDRFKTLLAKKKTSAGLTLKEFAEFGVLRSIAVQNYDADKKEPPKQADRHSAPSPSAAEMTTSPTSAADFLLPQPPTAEEHAAEVKRLRLIRESIERNEMVLIPSILKPAIDENLHEGGMFRRALAEIPDNLTCAPRKRFDSLPNFTRREEHVRPKYAVVSLVVRSSAHNADNTTRRSIMHELTFLNKLQYCKLHGYDFILEDESVIDTSRPPHWSKIRVLRKWLPFYEWIVWVDMDVILTNWERKIEDLVNDELTRHLLDDLKNQENNILKSLEDLEVAKVREAFWSRAESGGATNLDGADLAKMNSQVAEIRAHPVRNTTSRDLLPEFRMKQIDLIMTHDQNGLNNGVMFLRNRWWTHNFLRRVWAVPSVKAKPYFDQGAFRWLLTPGFRGRSEEDGYIDSTHLWNTDDNTFNANFENFIDQEENLRFRWQPGDWIVHLASCNSYPSCIQVMKYFADLAMCNNSYSMDPPRPINENPDTKNVFHWNPPSKYYPPSILGSSDVNGKALPTLPALHEPLWDVSGIAGSQRGNYFHGTFKKKKNAHKKKMHDAKK